MSKLNYRQIFTYIWILWLINFAIIECLTLTVQNSNIYFCILLIQLAYFLIFEGISLAVKKKDDTFSENFWAVLTVIVHKKQYAVYGIAIGLVLYLSIFFFDLLFYPFVGGSDALVITRRLVLFLMFLSWLVPHLLLKGKYG